MSAPEKPPPTPGPRYSAAQISMIALGCVLLLPGLCSLVFMGLSMGSSSSSGPLPLLWLLCFGIAAGGVVLIRYAIRNR